MSPRLPGASCILSALLPPAAGWLWLSGCDAGPRMPPLAAQRVSLSLDDDSPSRPMAGAFGDLDGDGLPGILVAEQDGPIHAYGYPGWERTVLSLAAGGQDLAVADMDGDGRQDVISAGRKLAWLRNPGPSGPWRERVLLVSGRLRDLVPADIDGDGRMDLLAREAAQGTTWLLLQETPERWTRIPFEGAPGTGAAVADMDGDGRLDLLGDGFYLAQGADARASGDWRRVRICGPIPGAAVAAVDVDGDGRLDLAAAGTGGARRVAWYRNPGSSMHDTVPWEEHQVARGLGTVVRLRAADVDRDGDPDLVFSEGHGAQPSRVGALLNPSRRSGAWSLKLLDDAGALDLAVADVGGDGRLEILAVASHRAPQVRLLTDILPSRGRLAPPIRRPRPADPAPHAVAGTILPDP